MPRRKHPLAKCLDVVDKLMKHPQAMQLFNAPVDIDGLGLTDYLEVVKQPMDLGTIRARLLAGQAAEWSTCEYSCPEHVLEHIKLVWNNCILYNSRPDEEPIARAAHEMAKKTEELWSQASIGCDPATGGSQESIAVIPEGEIPSSYNSPGAVHI
jgi:Bromodomain